jgi:hypothetical protein
MQIWRESTMAISRRDALRTGLIGVPSLSFAGGSTALAQTSSGLWSSCPSYLGQVATSCSVPDQLSSDATVAAHRSAHFNRAGGVLSSLRLVVPNFRAREATGTDQQWAARIEYPLNTCTTVTWNSNPIVLTDDLQAELHGGFSVSDPITLTQPIPDNAMFWVRLWQSAFKNPDKDAQKNSLPAILFQDMTGNMRQGSYVDRAINYALGETNCLGAPSSVLDRNVNLPAGSPFWMFTDSAGKPATDGFIYWVGMRPLAILGETRKPSFSLWGDSRMVGLGDTYNATSNNRGEVERTIGTSFAYVNFGIGGLPAADFAATIGDGVAAEQVNPFVHIAKTYTTNLIENLGGNDCRNNASTMSSADLASAIYANKQRIWNAWNNPLPSSQPQPKTLFAARFASMNYSSIATLTLPAATAADSGNWTTLDQTDGLNGNTNPYTQLPQIPTNYNAPIQELNTILLGSGNPVYVFDVASAVCKFATGHSGQIQFLWTPSPYAYTIDGVHENQIGSFAIHDSGAINPYVFFQ